MRGRLLAQLCRSSRPEDKRSGRFVKDYVSWGAGPRGSQNLVLAAKARALLLGRTATHVTLQVGAWTFHFTIDKEGRYPKVEQSYLGVGGVAIEGVAS